MSKRPSFTYTEADRLYDEHCKTLPVPPGLPHTNAKIYKGKELEELRKEITELQLKRATPYIVKT